MDRQYISRHGTVTARTFDGGAAHTVSLQRWNAGASIDVGVIRKARNDRNTGDKFVAFPICGCGPLSYRTLSGAAITLANGMMSTSHDDPHCPKNTA